MLMFKTVFEHASEHMLVFECAVGASIKDIFP